MDIKPAYKHSKFGNFMFNLCAKGTKFLIKHRGLYYLLACTWGILLTLLGGLITLVLAIGRIFTKNIIFEKYYWVYDIKVGPDWWGGAEMGLMFMRDHKSSVGGLNPHEGGHSFQNTILGPLTIFLVTIPSAARYGYNEIKGLKEPYDAAWFEDSATQCGKYAVAYLDNLKNK